MKKTSVQAPVPLLVLLVEDHPVVGRGMKSLLESEGYEVLWAKDTKEARTAYDLRRGEIKKAVLDGSMAGTSGDTTVPLIEYMKADGFGGLMLATSGLDYLVEEMMAAGCTAHCLKMDFLKHL